MEDYLNQNDWRVKENANSSYSLSNLFSFVSSSAVSEYSLQRIYKNHPISEMHEKGQVHIHDLSGGIAPYCAGWSLKMLLDEGFALPNSSYISSRPAKHFRSAIAHMINFLGVMSNEWMGAQAFSDVDVYLAPYLYIDYMEALKGYLADTDDQALAKRLADRFIKKEAKQSIQELLYSLNFPSRWGGQAPFTNFTLALSIPDDLKNSAISIAGELITDEENKTLTYGDMKEWVSLFNETFFKVYLEGAGDGKVFTFPVLTINVTEEFFNLPKKLLNLILTANKKYGATYFQNCIKGQSNLKPIKPDTVRSMCCRLSLDLKELEQHTGGLFGNGEMTGSIGVITLNLSEIAYESKNDEVKFMSILSNWMSIAAEALLLKKEEVLKNFEKGLFPYTKHYLRTKFRTHFLTIGYVGMHEALINFGFEKGLDDKKGHEFAIKILDFMRQKIQQFQIQYKSLFNLEATPSESTSYRLAMLSKKRIPELVTAGTKDSPYFTNSCHPPVNKQGSFVYVLKNQEELQCRHSGGTVVHFYIDGQPEEQTILTMIEKVCQSKIPYFTFSVVFSYCPVHGYIPGKQDFCPYPHTEEQLDKYGVSY